MRLTRTQWAILAGAAVLFIVALFAITDDDGDGDASPGFDEVVWCRGATAASGRAAVLDPAFDGDPGAEAANLVVELEAAVPMAPAELQPALARVLDLAILVREQLARGAAWPDALAAARANTDPARLDEALSAVSSAFEDCGAPGLPAGAAGDDPVEGP